MAQNVISLELAFRNKRFNDAATGLRYFAGSLKKDFATAAPVLKKDLKFFLDSVAQALAQRHSTPWPGGTTANTLSKRSGKGMQSILASVRVDGSTFEAIEGRIGGTFYLRIHEFGGTIRAKNVKYLTIPLPAAMSSQGIPLKKSARLWSDTFIAKSKKGNLIIFQRRGKAIVPLYVLKEEVKIPARLGMRKTIDAGIPWFVDRTMENMVKEIMKG